MKSSLTILACFVAGFALQALGAIPSWVSNAKFDTYALYVLMLLVGMLVGSDGRALRTIRKTGPRTLVVPLIAILGTAIGVVSASPLLSMDLQHALAVGFGLGYYSLSSILIGEWVGPDLAVVALLCNISRELLTLLTAPILLRLFGPLAPLVSGGATAMDTTLPIIIRCSGRAYAPIAVLSGVVLTILVPFLVSLALRL